MDYIHRRFRLQNTTFLRRRVQSCTLYTIVRILPSLIYFLINNSDDSHCLRKIHFYIIFQHSKCFGRALLHSAADNSKVDVCVVGSRSLCREMLVSSGGRRAISARLVAAALNRCDERPVLQRRLPEKSRGARCRSAETLRTVRPGMTRPELMGGWRR
jgi:hypothetical protein